MLAPSDQPFIHRKAVKGEVGWAVILGSGRSRCYRHFRDEKYHGTEAALQAAILYRDQQLPLLRQSWLERPATKREQLRIRLRHEEREAMERRREEDWANGQKFAENLSTWVRHQIDSLVDADKHPCEISRELYRKVEELARLLDKSPETIIKDCIDGIDHLIRHSDAHRPLIVAEWRLRKEYGLKRKSD